MSNLITVIVVVVVAWIIWRVYRPYYRRAKAEKVLHSRIGALKRELGPALTDLAIDEANEEAKKEKLKELTKLLVERNL